MKVCILKGGVSHEREISLLSAHSYENAVRDLGYDCISIDTAKPICEVLAEIVSFEPDVVVNALHGKFGEDGRIQSMLDFLKIPYTHSGVLGSAMAMNKHFTKIVAKDAGLSVASSQMVSQFDEITMDTPFVIKPVEDGSSVGVKLILTKADFENLQNEWGDGKFLIEEYISGQEITVGIINGNPIAVTAINNKREFYDYTAKYTSQSDASLHVLPAPIAEEYYDKVMNDTQKVYEALNLRGVARADFILSEKDQKLYFLEINTQPGMTSASLVPEQAKFRFGWDMKDLVKALIYAAKFDE